MVQNINPHPAPGRNRSPPPPTMYFRKMQFLGMLRPFIQRSLHRHWLISNCAHFICQRLYNSFLIYWSKYIHKCFTCVTKTIANLTTYSRKPGDYNGTIIFEIDIMKNSSPLNLIFTFFAMSKPK